MKCMIVLALVAAASASLEYGAAVEGAKAIIAGPSGTISADTGSIRKDGLFGTAIVAPRVALPLTTSFVAPRIIDPLLTSRTILAPKIVHSGIVDPFLGSRAFLGARSLGWNSDLIGARSLFY